MLTKDKSIAKLRLQIDEIPKIKTKSEFAKWRRDTEIIIEKIFGQETRHNIDFSRTFNFVGSS